MSVDIIYLILNFVAVCLGVAVGVLVINKVGKVILRKAIKARLNQQKSVESKYLNQITDQLWKDMTSANIGGIFPIELKDYLPGVYDKIDTIRKKNPDAFIVICARLAPLAFALKRAAELKGGIPPEIQTQMSQMSASNLGVDIGRGKP